MLKYLQWKIIPAFLPELNTSEIKSNLRSLHNNCLLNFLALNFSLLHSSHIRDKDKFFTLIDEKIPIFLNYLASSLIDFSWIRRFVLLNFLINYRLFAFLQYVKCIPEINSLEFSIFFELFDCNINQYLIFSSLIIVAFFPPNILA